MAVSQRPRRRGFPSIDDSRGGLGGGTIAPAGQMFTPEWMQEFLNAMQSDSGYVGTTPGAPPGGENLFPGRTAMDPNESSLQGLGSREVDQGGTMNLTPGYAIVDPLWNPHYGTAEGVEIGPPQTFIERQPGGALARIGRNPRGRGYVGIGAQGGAQGPSGGSLSPTNLDTSFAGRLALAKSMANRTSPMNIGFTGMQMMDPTMMTTMFKNLLPGGHNEAKLGVYGQNPTLTSRFLTWLGVQPDQEGMNAFIDALPKDTGALGAPGGPGPGPGDISPFGDVEPGAVFQDYGSYTDVGVGAEYGDSPSPAGDVGAMHTGGYVSGSNPNVQGENVPKTLLEGEMVMSPQAVQMFGPMLTKMNRMGFNRLG